jgi:hypothetical protein
MSLPSYMGCLMEFCKCLLYENVFQNPELFPTQVSLSPKQSSLDNLKLFCFCFKKMIKCQQKTTIAAKL